MAYEIPNFTSLAQQQAGLNTAAANTSTLANRANQNGPNGESMTWSQGPDGQWTQSVSLGAGQSAVNQGITGNQQAQLGQSTNTLNNLGGWGSSDITAGVSGMPDGGFGADQKTIDAWSALNEPGLKQNEDAERTRLAAMGITMGSDASNNSERGLGNLRTDASNKAILAGTQEYGNVFNRQLAQRQQGVSENVQKSNLMSALRGQQVSEAKTLGNQAAYDPKFASYAGATTAPAADVYGAARDEWAANQTQYQNLVNTQNQQQAQAANSSSGNMGLLGLGLNALGNKNIMSGIGSLGSTIGGWFGGSSNDALGDFISSNGWA